MLLLVIYGANKGEALGVNTSLDSRDMINGGPREKGGTNFLFAPRCNWLAFIDLKGNASLISPSIPGLIRHGQDRQKVDRRVAYSLPGRTNIGVSKL